MGIDNLGIVTTLGNDSWDKGVFQQCPNLEYAILPISLTCIGRYAFSNCNNLKTVVIYASTPPNLIATSAFEKTHSDLAFYVPDESVSAYQVATNWSAYAARIKGISTLIL